MLCGHIYAWCSIGEKTNASFQPAENLKTLRRFGIIPEMLWNTGAFELSRWRGGRCRVGCPRALLAV
jgi:hypothetical protein